MRPLFTRSVWHLAMLFEPRGFDDPGFPWSMQRQFVLLTCVDAPVPQLDFDDVNRMLAPPATDPDAWRAVRM